MKILVHCIHYPVASGRYAVDAFKRLGHDVRHVGIETGNNIWGIQVDPKYAWAQEPPEDGWQPDIAILMDTAYQWHYPDANVPTVVWSVDNHVRDLRQPGIAHYFLAHRGVSVMDWVNPYIPNKYMHHWRDDMTWLPCAYDPVHFTPSPIPYAEREYDVALVGVVYPQRHSIIRELQAAGLKVFWGTGLLFEDYRDAYHNSRISLCVSAAGDVAQRVFETAAMGCAVVSDHCPDLTRLDSKGVWVVDPQHMVGEIQVLLEDTEGIQRLIARSLEWVRPHTWDNRAQVIVNWLEKQQAGEVFYATAE